MNTDIQQNASANAQQNLDAQTDQLLGIINTYVQQFDATSDDTSEIPAIEDVLEELDNHMTPLFEEGLQQARYGVQKTKAKDSQRGGQLKAEVLKRLSGFQDYIRHIITCFLKGYHYKAQMLRGMAEAKTKFGNIQIDNPGEVGDILAKKRKEKHELGRLIDFIHTARPVIDKVDKDVEKLEQGLHDVLGKDDGAGAMRSVTSKLRKRDFDSASKSAAEIRNKKARGLGKFKSDRLPELAKQAEKLVQYYKDNSNVLFTEDDKSFFRTRELDLAMTQARKERDKAEEYLHKYYIAYLSSKHQSLEQARERLKTLVAPENILNKHRRIIQACGEVLADADSAYNFEDRYVVPLKQMGESQHEEIQRLEKRFDQIMSGFNTVMADIAEYEEAVVE